MASTGVSQAHNLARKISIARNRGATSGEAQSDSHTSILVTHQSWIERKLSKLSQPETADNWVAPETSRKLLARLPLPHDDMLSGAARAALHVRLAVLQRTERLRRKLDETDSKSDEDASKPDTRIRSCRGPPPCPCATPRAVRPDAWHGVTGVTGGEHAAMGVHRARIPASAAQREPRSPSCSSAHGPFRRGSGAAGQGSPLGAGCLRRGRGRCIVSCREPRRACLRGDELEGAH